MTIIRSILALLGGFLLMAALVIIGTFAAAALLAPDGIPNATYLIANLLLSFLAAIAGGYGCAWIAGRAPRLHAAMLALIVLVLGLVSEGRSAQPHWYPLLIPFLGALGVMIGAWLVRGRNNLDRGLTIG